MAGADQNYFELIKNTEEVYDRELDESNNNEVIIPEDWIGLDVTSLMEEDPLSKNEENESAKFVKQKARVANKRNASSPLQSRSDSKSSKKTSDESNSKKGHNMNTEGHIGSKLPNGTGAGVNENHSEDEKSNDE